MAYVVRHADICSSIRIGTALSSIPLYIHRGMSAAAVFSLRSKLNIGKSYKAPHSAANVHTARCIGINGTHSHATHTHTTWGLSSKLCASNINGIICALPFMLLLLFCAVMLILLLLLYNCSSKVRIRIEAPVLQH